MGTRFIFSARSDPRGATQAEYSVAQVTLKVPRTKFCGSVELTGKIGAGGFGSIGFKATICTVVTAMKISSSKFVFPSNRIIDPKKKTASGGRDKVCFLT